MSRSDRKPVDDVLEDRPHGVARLVFGVDDRKDYFEIEHDAKLKRLADSTVILTDKNRITAQADGSFKLDVRPYRINNMRPCRSERFGHQHTGGNCSGFMVTSDTIATAGHCVNPTTVTNVAFIFGFRATSADDPGTTVFRADQVYFGKELIAHNLSGSDFSIVRVDRIISATGATALEVRTSGEVKVNDRIGVIGYPSGLPVKIAFGDDTRVRRTSDTTISGNLDTFLKNSGSPVFNEDGLVEGILVTGESDFAFDHVKDCFRTKSKKDTDGDEDATRASVFAHHIPSNA